MENFDSLVVLSLFKSFKQYSNFQFQNKIKEKI